MSHRCQISDNSGCFEENNQLWVKEFYDGICREKGTYRVNFCPVCGFSIPKAQPVYLKAFIPASEPDACITQFSQSLSTAIHQMNHNVELMKSFMSSQNTQNQCFMDRDLSTSQEICSLKRKIEDLISIIQKAGL